MQSLSVCYTFVSVTVTENGLPASYPQLAQIWKNFEKPPKTEKIFGGLTIVARRCFFEHPWLCYWPEPVLGITGPNYKIDGGTPTLYFHLHC